ncbi:MAG TPA: phage holin family protein [Sphingobacteriaceae bacterium]|nr:phage holin family protein [Sphingobacteriaceae bacterium]
MEESNQEEQDIVSLIKEYISTRIELGRLTAMERLAIVLANLITDGFVIVAAILTFLFGSVTLALYLAELLGSYAGGFGIVTLIYMLLGMIMYFIKDRYVEKNLINFIIKRISRNRK